MDRDPLHDEYMIKLIDFGVASSNFAEIVSFTPPYFYNNKNRTKKLYNEGMIKFATPIERLKVELYALAITMLQIILLSQKDVPQIKGYRKYMKVHDLMKNIDDKEIIKLKNANK